ncbi:unnamed protein product [Nezara viridula]|uniref:Uncharacterized protein n=1 Tax=Nezara viridula TaxID=85310 RepID=A0A9P0EB09_NEZVI|nr:unnamed protein product [Nezara viridula]
MQYPCSSWLPLALSTDWSDKGCPSTPYRSLDGSCNNVRRPYEGAAYSHFTSLVSALQDSREYPFEPDNEDKSSELSQDCDITKRCRARDVQTKEPPFDKKMSEEKGTFSYRVPIVLTRLRCVTSIGGYIGLHKST